MTINREELKKKALEAASAEEIMEILKAAGEEITAEQADQLFERVQKQKEDQELSLDELEAVSGGADRDWEKDGCAATVESGSWCGSNDKCLIWDVTYSNMPALTCPICNGAMNRIDSRYDENVYQCPKCGHIKTVDTRLPEYNTED